MRVFQHSLAAGALVLLAMVPGAAPASALPETATHPNIVLILTDDLDTASMPLLPRLSALLAAQGTSFSNFIVSDSLCCPSRSTILRGQYNHNHHVHGNAPPSGGFQKFHDLGEERSTIATWLRASGYTTVLLGKYLNGYPGSTGKDDVPPGWSEWYSPVEGSPYTQYDYTLNENGRHTVANGHEEHDYLDDVLASKASKFILRQAGTGKPFFIYLAPYTPHKPYTPAPRYDGAFAGATAPRPPSFNEEDMSDKPEWARGQPSLGAADVAEIDDAWRRRLESMLAIEDMVARILDALNAAGKLDSTYIFFTSDNGYHLGEHRLLAGKQTLYEEDIRVPLIVRGPGVPAGAVLPHLVGNVDLAPTLADLAGAPAPDFVDGRSFASLLQSSPPDPASFRDALLLEHAEAGAAGSRRASERREKEASDGTLEPEDPIEIGRLQDHEDRIVPGFEGLEFVVGGKTLTLRDAQHEYVFAPPALMAVPR